MSQDQEFREYARKSIKKKQDFKTYLWVYFAVTLLVTATWWIVMPGMYFWPIWVYFGMGIGALFTGLDAYGKLGAKPITDSDVDAEVERLRGKG